MPLLFYQIGVKFRDEKRPRSGLLRAKEFLMKGKKYLQKTFKLHYFL